jgi:hypothetical protein
MDEDTEKAGRPASKEKKFTRFSPRRDASEEKKKQTQLGLSPKNQAQEAKQVQ